MNDQTPGDRRFAELLPWYVSGQLEGDDARWMAAHLGAHPAAAGLLREHRALRGVVRQHLADLPADLGWQDYAARHGLVEGLEAADEPAVAEGMARAEGARAAPAAPRRPWWRPWLGYGTGALVLAQFALIVLLWNGHLQDAGWAGQRSGPVPPQPASAPATLLLRVAPDAPEQAWRRLLLAVDGQIVSGPSQSGEYEVLVPVDRLDAARATLAAHPIVQELRTAPPRP